MNLNELKSRLYLLFQEGKYAEMKEEAEDFLFENEGDAEMYLLLAKSSAISGEVGDTEYYCLKTKAVDPSNIEALNMLASLKIQLKDSLSAQHYLDAILKINPNDIKAIVLSGDLLYADKMYDGALERYRKVLEMKGDALKPQEMNLVVFHAASAEAANQHFTEALELIQNFGPADFNEILTKLKRNIFIALGADKMPDLIATVISLQANVPNNPEYIFELLQYLETDPDLNKKLDLLNNCLALQLNEQQKTLALRKRAELYAAQGKWAEASADYHNLLQIKEDWFDYQRSAAMKEQLNDLKGAIQDISKAIKMIEKPYAPLISTRARLLMKGGLNEKAIEDLTALLNLSSDDDDSETYFNLGIAYNKTGDKVNAVKMLIRAEMQGHEKASELLLKSFSEHLVNARQKTSAKFLDEFKAEFDRNKRSPILSKAFGKLWVPNMYKFMLSNEKDISIYPASIIKQMLKEAEKDMFMITPEGLLLFEGDEEPIEAFYKVEIESVHSILIEVQPTKGAKSFGMKLMFHEDNLLLTYPVGEADIPAKYFIDVEKPDAVQKERLLQKKVNVPYMDSIEHSISGFTK
jgi:tetratricopeptide (TPR) repeat protein